MELKTAGCRLCLDAFGENFTTIDNPKLKEQMNKVFCFSIEPKQGYSSSVCQSCSYAISEFFQYSEKVRQNQEVLNGNVTSYDPTVDSKITLESVKFEAHSSSELPETIKDVCKWKDEVSEEEIQPLDSEITIENVKVETLSDSGLPETIEDASESDDEISDEEDEASNSGGDESYEPPSKKSQTSPKGCLRKRKLDDMEADAPTNTTKQITMKRRQKRFEEDQLFNKHIRMICDLCGTSAANFSKLCSHFYKEHKRRSGYVVCCNKKLFKRYTIRDHVYFHINPDAFRCEVCGNKYKSKAILNEHRLCMHSSEHSSAGSFKCDHCPQCFAQQSALDKHMEWHLKLTCRKCNKVLASKSSLCVHMARMHSDKEWTMVCDTCGKEFRDKQCFDRHVNEHKGIQVPRIQCEVCQSWLKGEKYLRRHMNRLHTGHHTDKVVYNCEYCEVSKNSKQNIQYHVKRHHPTEWAQKKLKQ